MHPDLCMRLATYHGVTAAAFGHHSLVRWVKTTSVPMGSSTSELPRLASLQAAPCWQASRPEALRRHACQRQDNSCGGQTHLLGVPAAAKGGVAEAAPCWQASHPEALPRHAHQRQREELRWPDTPAGCTRSCQRWRCRSRTPVVDLGQGSSAGSARVPRRTWRAPGATRRSRPGSGAHWPGLLSSQYIIAPPVRPPCRVPASCMQSACDQLNSTEIRGVLRLHNHAFNAGKSGQHSLQAKYIVFQSSAVQSAQGSCCSSIASSAPPKNANNEAAV